MAEPTWEATLPTRRMADAVGVKIVVADLRTRGLDPVADDMPLKMRSKVNCTTTRIWTYVRDERSWNSQAPPAAWYLFSTDRKGAHPADHRCTFSSFSPHCVVVYLICLSDKAHLAVILGQFLDGIGQAI